MLTYVNSRWRVTDRPLIKPSVGDGHIRSDKSMTYGSFSPERGAITSRQDVEASTFR